MAIFYLFLSFLLSTLYRKKGKKEVKDTEQFEETCYKENCVVPGEVSQESRQQLTPGLLPALGIGSLLAISIIGLPQERIKGITVSSC